MSAHPDSIFRNRDLMLIWLGQAVSVIGDRVHGLVVAWWVLERTGDPARVGQVLLAATLPMVLLAPLGGALADRWARRAILFTSDLARGLLVLGLAALEARGGLDLPVLLAATALMNAISAVFTPTLLAATPTLVAEDQVMQASSLQDAVAGGAGILGPALGGALVAAVGPAIAFALNGSSYLISAGTTRLARGPRRGGLPSHLAPRAPPRARVRAAARAPRDAARGWGRAEVYVGSNAMELDDSNIVEAFRELAR